jgi:uncharacterized protein with ParB-like and HNH nuclease domain
MNTNRKMDVSIIGFSEIFRSNKNDAIHLSIPQYQRDFSWEESHIHALMSSLCDASDVSEQSVFLGTILFNQAEKDSTLFDIVDGQQRITTLLLLIRYIDIELNQSTIINDMLPAINNGDTNREMFNIAWNLEAIEEIRRCKQGKAEVAEMNNRYKRCLLYIKSYLDTKLEDDKEDGSEDSENKELHSTDDSKEMLYKKLLDVIFEKVFFVQMITIERPLPQVVKIFNTINSTGMDLNCSDLFKLQFYEYLKNKKDPGLSKEDILPAINKCYEDIALLNSNNNITGKVQMSDFLDIYKHILSTCFKSKSVWSWLKKSNETFFDELFNNAANEHNEHYLTFQDFRRAVDIYLELFSVLNDKTNQTLHNLKATTFLSPELLETTRYSRYWTIPYVYAFFNIKDMSDNEQRHKVYIKALEFTEELYKYFMVQSISYEKVINPVQTFICDTVLKELKISGDEAIKKIKEKMNISPYEWQTDNKMHVNWINARLTGNIYENYARARIICILSALFDEESNIEEGNAASIFDIKNYFFNWSKYKYDLEHVYSRKDFKDDTDRNLYNSLGNLVVLERRINRRLGNKSINGYDKKADYEDDKYYAAPKRIFNNYKEWGTTQISDRLEKKTDEIRDYLGVKKN